MKLRTDFFDLWVFWREDGVPKYLLLHTSQEKEDRWFSGGRFWQIPGGVVEEGEELVASLVRMLGELGQEPRSLWTVEHTYIIYNRRRQDLEIIPVFAAEVEEAKSVVLTWEHSEYGWYTADECNGRISFRHLREGLEWTRKYITEQVHPAKEFRIL